MLKKLKISTKKHSLNHQLQLPFLTQDWQNVWFETLGQNYKPFFIKTKNGCSASFALKDQVAIFSGGYEIADYLDIVGPEDQKLSAWPEIISELTNHGIKQLKLRNIPQDSKTLSFFADKTEVLKEDTTPYIELPNNWDAYLTQLDRKNRHELKRKMRKFEREFPNSQIVKSPNPNKDIEILLNLMRLNPDKNKFLTPEMVIFFKRIAYVFANDIILLFLKVGKQIAGAMLEFKTEKSILTYNSGFDEKNFSGAGFYLKALSIKQAIEKGYKEYNFLQGSERYKYELGGKDFSVYSLTYDLK